MATATSEATFELAAASDHQLRSSDDSPEPAEAGYPTVSHLAADDERPEDAAEPEAEG